jgi:hypothetical protein
MKSVISLLGFAALTMQPSWGFAQADAQMLCQRYAEESGLADEEIAEYIADCMVNLGGKDPAPTRSDDVGSEAAVESASEEGALESTEQHASDAEVSESVEDYASDEVAAESPEEYASDEEASASREDYSSDETAAEQAMDAVVEEDDDTPDPDVDEAGPGPTSPFGEPR